MMRIKDEFLTGGDMRPRQQGDRVAGKRGGRDQEDVRKASQPHMEATSGLYVFFVILMMRMIVPIQRIAADAYFDGATTRH
jgi:hypothetical protein